MSLAVFDITAVPDPGEGPGVSPSPSLSPSHSSNTNSNTTATHLSTTKFTPGIISRPHKDELETRIRVAPRPGAEALVWEVLEAAPFERGDAEALGGLRW